MPTSSLRLLVHRFADRSAHLAAHTTALMLLALVWVQCSQETQHSNYLTTDPYHVFTLQEGEQDVQNVGIGVVWLHYVAVCVCREGRDLV